MGAATGSELARDDTGPVVPPEASRVLAVGALAIVAALSVLLAFLVSAVLRGPAVINGLARGTALVVLVVGVPVLACSLVLGRRGSAIVVVSWLAAPGFLLYLAMLSLAAWSAGTLLWHADMPALGHLIPARAPVRLVAVYLWALVILNGDAWLARILPTPGGGDRAGDGQAADGVAAADHLSALTVLRRRTRPASGQPRAAPLRAGPPRGSACPPGRTGRRAVHRPATRPASSTAAARSPAGR